MIWIFRSMLIATLTLMSYVALLPMYNFSPWVPDSFLLSLGVTMPLIELMQAKADKIAHFFGAFLMMVLVFKSLKATTHGHTFPVMLMALLGLVLVAVAAELAQLSIGRHFSNEDIVAGGALGLATLQVRRRRRVHCRP